MKNESGNVLIILLVAIVLLGALTALLTRSGGSTNETGELEQQSIVVSEILRYASSIEAAVTRLRQRGCSENQLSFQYDADGDGDYTDTGETPDYRNANAPSDLSCHIFHPNGGGQTYESPEADWLDSTHSAIVTYGDYAFTRRTEIADVGENTEKDLTLFINFIIRDLCVAINNTLDLPNPSGEPPVDDGDFNSTDLFDGTFDTGSVSDVNPPELIGEKSGCFKHSSNDQYFFYHVLIAR
ncbi:MAG: hypothetical protein AAF569_03790 [Pseudomonadota bacterium]